MGFGILLTEYLIDINEFMKMHKEWRQWTQSQRRGFFPIFNKSFLEKLPHITGNAVRLYLFLGAHINNQDGSTTVSIETIMHRFDAIGCICQ